MIPLTHMAGQSVGVLGLGASGLAAANALKTAGADVTVWDDNADTRAAAQALGYRVAALEAAKLDMLVSSPGIPMVYPAPHPMIAQAKAKGVRVIGDVELFAQARSNLPEHSVISITGTNGKSTATALIAHLLKTSGRPAYIGGNFGPPMLSLEPKAGVYVLELSSFQLEQTQSLKSDIAVFLNLTPDHGDRYASIESYAAAKQRLFDMQGKTGRAIIAADDAEGQRLASHVQNDVVMVNANAADGAQWFFKHGALYHKDACVSQQRDWPDLQGPHNAQNAAAAAAACFALGLSYKDIAAGLQSYQALAHRSQTVGRIGEVQFVNDSKATNPDATMKALQAFPAIHWLAGGSDKGSDFSGLAGHLQAVQAGYFFGQTKEALEAALPNLSSYVFDTLADAFAAAARDAQNMDAPSTVLLSPACASFDQFKSYAHRGEVFTALVQALEKEAA